ncbi:MAG: Gx transporter family protein [Desulfosarcinaceae bacterium]|nr:Gx transporter family protein [Desulfosarcinaceae bacterium]
MTLSAADALYRSGKIPFLVATASILQISESMLPHPVPGLRFGLANIIALILLVQYGFKPALLVTLLRTVVSSFVLGTFLSPGFILSFCAGGASITVLGLCHGLSARVRWLPISPIGLGILGAFVHNMVQLGLAYLLLLRHPGIFFLVPWLSFGSVVLGALSGALAVGVLDRLTADGCEAPRGSQSAPPLQERVYQPALSWLHRCSPTLKIAAVLALTLTTVLVENLALYGVLFAIILLLIPSAALRYRRVFQVLNRLWFIILGAFLLPLYFNPGSLVLIDTGLFALHREAVIRACVFAGRIILLALVSHLVAQTTRAEEFTRGIQFYLKPFRRLGLQHVVIAETLSRSLTLLPAVWTEVRSVLSALLAGRPKNWYTLKSVVLQLLCYLFANQNGRP